MPVSTLKTLREKLLLEWTYNSNAIEGNTLTLKETKVVLEGITVGGKTMREHLEIINHSAAILYYEALDKAHTKERFDDFIELVKDELADTLDLYLESL